MLWCISDKLIYIGNIILELWMLNVEEYILFWFYSVLVFYEYFS